jgi:outer membrane protein OmpA-like peptidoglycan-associated protein
VTIDVAADVLFAVDSAELSAEAVARLQQVAADVTARAVPGALSVVGHTDSDASEAYNDDLSARRAQAVAGVLGPALAGTGLNLTVEGRGEREPVADNSTDEGKQANRRVAITFTEEQE